MEDDDPLETNLIHELGVMCGVDELRPAVLVSEGLEEAGHEQDVVYAEMSLGFLDSDDPKRYVMSRNQI